MGMGWIVAFITIGPALAISGVCLVTLIYFLTINCHLYTTAAAFDLKPTLTHSSIAMTGMNNTLLGAWILTILSGTLLSVAVFHLPWPVDMPDFIKAIPYAAIGLFNIVLLKTLSCRFFVLFQHSRT